MGLVLGYICQVAVSCTILLDRTATCELDNHTLKGEPTCFKLLYQSVLFKNSESAWPLEVLFISIKDMDEENVQEDAQ